MDLTRIYNRMQSAKHGNKGVRLSAEEITQLLPALSLYIPELGQPEVRTSPQAIPEKKTTEKLHMHIRWMIRRDMAEVLNIETQCFEFPWLEEDFIKCLRQRNCIGMVAERGEKVLGFMIYELHKTKLHILNFAVLPSHRYQTIGRQMAEKLISKLSTARRTEITLESRESHIGALMFFKALGFKAIGMLHGYYEDTDESAIAMRYLHCDPCEKRR